MSTNQTHDEGPPAPPLPGAVNSPGAPPRPARRLDFVDAHRGLAVVLMLWMHTADGWLRPGLKQGLGWGWVRAAGGLAAPTFLLLAGVSVSLSWAGPSTPAQRRSELARGLQLVVLGYGLRLQMWMLDAGGMRHAICWAAAVPLLCGYVAAYRSLSAWGRAAPEARLLGYVAVIAGATGLLIVSEVIHNRLLALLRVDVLQAIGASLACLALLHEPLRVRPWLGVALGAGVALLTPWMRTLVPGPLPVPIAGYLAAWDTPPAQLAPTLFPLFPWLAYAFAGASLGQYLGRAEREHGSGERTALRLSGIGVVLALLSCEALRPAHRVLIAVPSLTQPARVTYRIAVSLVLGGLAVLLTRRKMPTRKALLDLGRASLFVYWVHLELAFGSISRPLARKLDYRGWALGLTAMVVLMTFLSPLWLRLRRRIVPRMAVSESEKVASAQQQIRGTTL